MKKSSLFFMLLLLLAAASCRKKPAPAAAPVPQAPASEFRYIPEQEEAEEDDADARPLNDIRFGDWDDDERWVNNAYVDTLRAELDRMARAGDGEVPFAAERFAVLMSQPHMLGGLYVVFVFQGHFDKPYAAWIYSDVDAKTERVSAPYVRSIVEEEDLDAQDLPTEAEMKEEMRKNPAIRWH